MNDKFAQFENIVRKSFSYSDARERIPTDTHPFRVRDIHSRFPTKVRKLFDDGHFSEATFEAFKYIESEVKRLSGASDGKIGFQLMTSVFSDQNPQIKLNDLATDSKKDEQKGFMHLFAGSISAIRNPRGHEHSFFDSIDECLDYLSLASMLLRRLEQAGYELQ